MITNKEIETFLSLFQKAPNTTLLNIDHECPEIKESLFDFTEKINGKLTYKEFNSIDLDKFKLVARDFEYVVVTDCLNEIEDIDKFIKVIYHSLENSANVILISHKNKNSLQFMVEVLDRNDFRATNSIDIFNDYDLVVAKKMHMWGNGL